MKEIDSLTKEKQLRDWMLLQEGVLVAFSGGVDSSYLALIATEVLRGDALIVTGVSASVSEYQLGIAKRIAVRHGFRHLLIDTNETGDPDYIKNAGNRCYFCKGELYGKLASLAGKQRRRTVVIDGTNADDLTDVRPGRIAASEKGVISPLADLGFSKSDIRTLSKHHGLETWHHPASPCLASRVAVGVPVLIERLDLVERGEEILRDFGFREFRLRVNEHEANIEIAREEMTGRSFMSDIGLLGRRIKSLGFHKVRLDPEGYTKGSSNGSRGRKSHELIELA